VKIRADQEHDGQSWPFVVAPGTDGTARLHRWLEGSQAAGAIGCWYHVGSKSDERGTFALISFQNEEDGVRACAAWQRAKVPA
jgi:hypothetical protein